MGTGVGEESLGLLSQPRLGGTVVSADMEMARQTNAAESNESQDPGRSQRRRLK